MTSPGRIPISLRGVSDRTRISEIRHLRRAADLLFLPPTPLFAESSEDRQINMNVFIRCDRNRLSSAPQPRWYAPLHVENKISRRKGGTIFSFRGRSDSRKGFSFPTCQNDKRIVSVRSRR